MDVATISIFIVIAGCIIGLAEWVRLVKQDAGITAAKIHALETKLEHLQEEFSELKENEKNIEAAIQKALEEKIFHEEIFILLKEYRDLLKKE